MPKVLAFSGSSHRHSLNRKLLETAVCGATIAGAQVTAILLSDLRLPVYEADWELEHGIPSTALEFKNLIGRHDALLIATPEHNGGYTALLKNALDWASRPTDRDPTGLAAFAGKVAALVSASTGRLGGIRSQIALQVSLAQLGVLVIPHSIALGEADRAFDGRGLLRDAAAEKAALAVGAALSGATAGMTCAATIA